MLPAQAQRTAAHGRRLLTFKTITPTDYAVLDAMLWRLRRPGRWELAAPYKTIARLAGVCRDTAIASVRKLIEVGLVQKIKRRIRVAWGRNRANIASRQAANTYVFRAPSTESASPAVDKGIARVLPSIDSNSALERALSRLGAVFKDSG